MVLDGRGKIPFFTNAFSDLATSRIDTQPEALSFAPGRG